MSQSVSDPDERRGRTVAIPLLSGPYSTLPAGRHPATLEEIHQKFVVDAPHRDSRELVYRAFVLYTDILRVRLGPVTLWVDGGFISHKPWAPPSDIDVVVIVPQHDYTNICSNGQAWPLSTLQHVSSNLTQGLDRLQPMGGLIDGFVVPDSASQLAVWDATWSRVKDEHGNLLPETIRKGYLEVTL
ncbi:DUF6932 family protein [Gordonia polyisoprenivorans]|uniref:DUF6932 family protein n=1 Tax=Gordonia polyisoprenivorans TaxID=84595 RepID=UPI003F86A706